MKALLEALARLKGWAAEHGVEAASMLAGIVIAILLLVILLR